MARWPLRFAWSSFSARNEQESKLDIWTPLKTLFLRPNSDVLFLRSANISLCYPVRAMVQSRRAHQDRSFLGGGIFKWGVAALFAASASAAHAAEKQVFTVYTYDAFAADWGPAPKVKEAFEKTCECVLKFVAADSAIGALRKVQLEGDDTQADIVLGLDTNVMEAARATGLFIAHEADMSGLALPIEWTDKTFLPFDYGHFAFVYDKTKLSIVPDSFAALAAMPDEFKIIIQDPRASTPGLGLALWVHAVFGDEAGAYWRSIAPKILTVTKSWSDAYGLFLKGEADMVLSYTTSPAYHLIAEQNTNYESAPFTDGHYAQIEVAAIVKSTPFPRIAKKFMAFMVSDEFQNIIPTTNWMYPAVKTAVGLPAGFETLSTPNKTLLLDATDVEDKRKAIIDTWLQALNP
jgi:thiamine transport system substrate-binding protein